MKTKEQYFKECREKREQESIEREKKWTEEICEEIKDWDINKLKEEYTKVRLSKIVFTPWTSDGMLWDCSKDECRFCCLEYIGEHDHCCDNCWDDNKYKSLEELE